MAAVVRLFVLITSLISIGWAATATQSGRASASQTGSVTAVHEFPATGCFDCGKGVSRLNAGIAASACCQYWYGHVMYADSSNAGGYGYI